MPGFHMIATIAVIAAIAEKKKVQRSQRSHRKHSPAIAATTIPEIEKVPSQRLLSLQSLDFFFSAIVAIIWKTGLRDRNTSTTLTDDLSLDQKCM